MLKIGWVELERLTGLRGKHIQKHGIFTYFIAILAITIRVLALLDVWRSKYGGSMTYGKDFASGLIITAIVTLFSPVVQYLRSELIRHDYFSNMTQVAVSKGKISREEAEACFNLPSYIGQVLVGRPVMGIVTKANVAIFTRKNTGVRSR